jgi:hypothetical protein
MPRLPGRPGSRASSRTADATTTTVSQARDASPTEPLEATPARERVGRQARALPTRRRERAMERRALLVLAAVVGLMVGVAAIARSLSDVIEARAQVVQARSLNEGIRAQVESGRHEIEFAQSDAYLRFASRSVGYGRAGREEAFALRDGAAPAPSITPLGADRDDARDDVFAGFLDLLLEP